MASSGDFAHRHRANSSGRWFGHYRRRHQSLRQLSGIFGVVSLNGFPPDPGIFDILSVETAHWGQVSRAFSSEGLAGLGSAINLDCNDGIAEGFPVVGLDGSIFTAAGRVDNRNELADELGLRAACTSLGDGLLMHRAWVRWGVSCPERILGDWALAAWEPAKRRFLMARDHSGTTALYYHVNSGFFAFSSSRKALLKLNNSAAAMDELYLAQILVGWQAYHGERTIHKHLKRLPPAHYLTIAHNCVAVRQYWQLENTKELLLPRNDYVPAFLNIFDRVLRDHVRGEVPIAATLSGGLDSSSVVATGAGHLRNQGRRLAAFTSVPVSTTEAYTKGHFGDELPFARAVAEVAGNVDLLAVDAKGVCPIDAIRRALQISLEPKHGACNMFWLLELRRMAAARGCRILLTGSRGNEGISWAGDIFSQPALVQVRALGWARWLKGTIRRNSPSIAQSSFRRYRLRKQQWSESAIHPDFAKRMDLMNLYLADQDSRASGSPLLPRSYGMSAGATFQGASQAEMGTAAGLEIRDPTADARVLAFCYSVPDRIFINPETGVDRWLIREAMKGRLPESVRMNRRRGTQAADLVPRLRKSAPAVECALSEIEGGPAAEYLNVLAMRKAWEQVRTEDTPQALLLSAAVLARGIMAGLFVNGFGTNW